MKIKKVSLFGIINGTILIILALLCIYPFYFSVIVSISSSSMGSNVNTIFIPKGVTLDAYKLILRPNFFDAFKISVLRTFIGTAIALVMQCSLAYGLSKSYLKGHSFFRLMVVFTLIFSGGMIPTYLIVRGTKLLNTIWALIIPGAVSSWNVVILTSFFQSIPESIEESAKIDGANDIIILIRLILPLSMASVMTIGLFTAVGHWNSLMDGVLYITKSNLKPLQNFLYNLIMQSKMWDMYAAQGEQDIPTMSIENAAIMCSTLPILLVYPFIQRYFIKGVMLGAIKG